MFANFFGCFACVDVLYFLWVEVSFKHSRRLKLFKWVLSKDLFHYIFGMSFDFVIWGSNGLSYGS